MDNPLQPNLMSQANMSNFNPRGAQQMRTLRSTSFPNLRSAGMDAGAGSAGIGAAPSTPQFASTDLSKLGVVTTPYGGSTVSQFNKSKGESFHPGIDIAGPMGEKIPSFTGGTVVESVSGKKKGDAGYGNYIIVKDQNGNQWRYSHLYANYVRVGTKVTQGEVIGEMGNSGNTFSTTGGQGTHLDLRVRDAYTNLYVDPNKFFRKTTS